MCVPLNQTCDYFVDCNDNSDEDERAGCVCDLAYEFQCASGGCVNNTWVCDGQPDCFDGSDEAAELCGNVTEAGTTIRPTQFATEGKVTKSRFSTPVSPAESTTGEEVTKPEATTPVSPAESTVGEEVTKPEITPGGEATEEMTSVESTTQGKLAS